jgi:ketosteroid isomerase-like protein
LEIDWRDLKVDVFGDVAVVTSLPRFIMTAEDGAVDGFDAAATLVWVRAADGWRIAHENINVIVDIIQDPFPEAQEAVRAAILSLEGIGRSRDWEALRAAHLEGPKFTDFGTGMRRHDFEQMLATEIAGISGMDDFSADFRDLKIDVFGNVAVATSFPIYTGTSANGEKIEIERRATMIYVETRDGWKIAHEHLSKPEPE